MSTIQEYEEKADKWYMRLEKKPILFLLALSLFHNVWTEIKRDSERKDARQDLKEARMETAAVRIELRVRDKELSFAIEKAVIAQDKTIALYERLYPSRPLP